MKKFFSLILAFLFVYSMFCPHSTATLDDATPIDIGENISGAITEEDADDTYVFSISSAGKLDIDLTIFMHHLKVILYDSSGNVITNNNFEWNSSTHQGHWLETRELALGTYYLQFIPRQYYEAYGNYEFTLTFTSANVNHAEPSQNMAQACEVQMDTRIFGHIALNDSNDFYKFTLPSAGRLDIDLNSYMSHISVRLYNEVGDVISSNYYEWNSSTHLGHWTLPKELSAGTYYLQFTLRQYYEAYGNYDFLLAFTSANVNHAEPNQSMAQACEAQMDTRIFGHIALNDSNDFYKITLPSAGKLEMDLNSYFSYITVRLYSEEGNVVTSNYYEWNSATQLGHWVLPTELSAGTYYLHFTLRQYYEAYGNYDFLLSLTSANVNHTEPNQSTATASEISFGEQIFGHLAINDRVDFYKVELDGRESIRLDFNSFIGWINVTLFDSDVNKLDSVNIEWNSASQSTHRILEYDVPSQTCYIMVTTREYYECYGNYNMMLVEYQSGDVNQDNDINTGDAAFILRFASGLETLTPEQILLADINGDGDSNTGDAAYILRIVAGLE